VNAVDELDLIRGTLEARVLELEERLDFAERRMLQQPSALEAPPNPGACTPVQGRI